MPAVSIVPAADRVDLVDAPPAGPGPGEVLVRVEAAPVHPVDVWVQTGALAGALRGEPPYTPGWGAAGVVEQVGAGADGLRPGDEVVGLSEWFDTLVGTHASSVVLPAPAVALRPATLAPRRAAVIALNAPTAQQALDLLDLPAGARLGVVGAAGGVGGYAVELARHRGLEVVGVAEESDRAFVERTGATLVRRPASVDDLAAALVAVGGPLDGLLDAVPVGAPALAAVRDGGAYVTVVGPAAPPAERGVRVDAVHVRADGGALAELARLADRGVISARVAATFPLADAARAYEAVGAGGLRGAVVLEP